MSTLRRSSACAVIAMAAAQIACGGSTVGTPRAAASATTAADTAQLTFVPDAGVRVDQAGLPEAGIDGNGVVHLYYGDSIAHGERVALSPDGLEFGGGVPPPDHANDPRRVLLPDGTWRLYQLRPDMTLQSERSSDGVHFSAEPGVRYRPAPGDHGEMGIYELFADRAGGVVMLYLGDLHGLNNTRRAYSTDGGATFTHQADDVLGDASAGGGSSSYVDITTVPLPDGRRRLFGMRGGQGIYSFVTADDGLSFTQEPGARVLASDWTEFHVVGLFDPSIVRLPDGRYRMYVAGSIETAATRRDVILSATTR